MIVVPSFRCYVMTAFKSRSVFVRRCARSLAETVQFLHHGLVEVEWHERNLWRRRCAEFVIMVRVKIDRTSRKALQDALLVSCGQVERLSLAKMVLCNTAHILRVTKTPPLFFQNKVVGPCVKRDRLLASRFAN